LSVVFNLCASVKSVAKELSLGLDVAKGKPRWARCGVEWFGWAWFSCGRSFAGAQDDMGAGFESVEIGGICGSIVGCWVLTSRRARHGGPVRRGVGCVGVGGFEEASEKCFLGLRRKGILRVRSGGMSTSPLPDSGAGLEARTTRRADRNDLPHQRQGPNIFLNFMFGFCLVLG